MAGLVPATGRGMMVGVVPLTGPRDEPGDDGGERGS